MDEVALALDIDPVEFRLRYLSEARDKAVVKAAAEKAGWQPRTGARKQVEGRRARRPGHRPMPRARAPASPSSRRSR